MHAANELKFESSVRPKPFPDSEKSRYALAHTHVPNIENSLFSCSRLAIQFLRAFRFTAVRNYRDTMLDVVGKDAFSNKLRRDDKMIRKGDFPAFSPDAAGTELR